MNQCSVNSQQKENLNQINMGGSNKAVGLVGQCT